MTTTVSEGVSNLVRMKALVAESCVADPALARRCARFFAALNHRQRAALEAACNLASVKTGADSERFVVNTLTGAVVRRDAIAPRAYRGEFIIFRKGTKTEISSTTPLISNPKNGIIHNVF